MQVPARQGNWKQERLRCMLVLHTSLRRGKRPSPMRIVEGTGLKLAMSEYHFDGRIVRFSSLCLRVAIILQSMKLVEPIQERPSRAAAIA